MATWEAAVLALLDDLEQQATGQHLQERDLEVADLSRVEYAHVTLDGRVHASVGSEVRLQLVGGRVVTGRVARAGRGWLLVADPASEWLVRTSAVVAFSGLSPRAATEEAWSVADRLGLATVLRRLADDGAPCVLHAVDGQTLQGRVGRVASDFVEVHLLDVAPRAAVQVVPTAAVAAWQGRR